MRESLRDAIDKEMDKVRCHCDDQSTVAFRVYTSEQCCIEYDQFGKETSGSLHSDTVGVIYTDYSAGIRAAYCSFDDLAVTAL